MPLKVIKNSFFVFISHSLLLLSSLGVYILIGRKLGPEGLGQFSLVLAYIGLFTFLADFGLSFYLIREISREPENIRKNLGIAFTTVLIIAPFTYVIPIIISQFIFEDPEIINGIYIAGFYILLGAGISLFRAAFHAYEHMEYETYVVTIERLITLIGTMFVLMIRAELMYLLIAHSISRFIGLILSMTLFSIKIARLPHFIFELPRSIMMLKHSLPFALNLLTTSIYVQVDLILLSLWIGDQATGYYKAATSLIIPLAVVATALNSAMFPSMARLFITSMDKLRQQMITSIRYLYMIGWPTAIGIFLLAPQIINLLYGSMFHQSILPLQLLSIIVPLRFINNTLGTSLTAMNKQELRALIIIFSAVLNIILNLYMIQKWSYIGASISTIITEIIIFVGLYLSIQTNFSDLNLARVLDKIFLCGLMMGIVTYLLRFSNLFVTILISGIIYGIALIVMQALPKNDITRLINAVQELR